MENSVTKPFRFDLSQSQQFNLNSTKVQSFNFQPIFLPSLSFLRIWMVQSKHGELTSEIFNLLPELWHQVSVMSWNHLLLMRSICCASDAVGHLEFIEVRQFVTLSFVWLLLIAKWWMHWTVQNKEGSGLCRLNCFFSAHDLGVSEKQQILMVWKTTWYVARCFSFR